VKIVVRKLDKDTHGPDDFGMVSEQEFIEWGYVWHYEVYDGSGMCFRAGASKIRNYDKLREYLLSGMNRLDWEAIHGTD
jgi:hypothetical protein